jgi:protein SCO1
MLWGLVLANALLVIVAGALYLNRAAQPPQIQGVLMQQPQAVGPFVLLDHTGASFDNKDLQGQWHLVSYGFTSCPDICPSTLSVLKDMAARLNGSSPRVLFYSVDHRRDTVEQMAAYLPFFSNEFVGLTHRDQPENPHLPFEQGLGISARLVPAQEGGANAYDVLHGVTLMLLNPAGQLQAIFKPVETAPGIYAFEADTLARDFRAIRDYLQRSA